MSSAKILFFFCVLAGLLRAEGVPFNVSSTTLPPTSVGGTTGTPKQSDVQPSGGQIDNQNDTISQLKQLAVVEWLQGYLGSRFANYERYITPEFTEKYILDYKVNRSTQPQGGIDLSGHLDGDSLKRWVRLLESKGKGGTSQIRPLLVLSSNLTQFPVSPMQTSEKIRESSIGQSLSQLINQAFARLNTRANGVDNSFGLSALPRNDDEMQTLRNAGVRGGENTAVWVALSACNSCGGARVEMFFYSLPSLRLIFAVGDDLSLNGRDLNNAEFLKRVLTPVYQQFQAELESAVSDGKLFVNAARILIEEVPSYRVFKAIETELLRSDFLSEPVFKKAEGKSAEFAVLSTYSPEELARRVETITIGNRRLKATRIDGTTVVVRYLKQ